MKNADLAEIRALLQASAEPERRSRRPFMRKFQALIATPPAEPPAPAYPPPRRVGLRPPEPVPPPPLEIADIADILDEAAILAAKRRPAFGQRPEPRAQPAPVLLLAAPAPPVLEDADVGLAMRRLGSSLIRQAPPPTETPFHPEDLSDHGEHETERLYAASGLFAAPTEPVAAAEPQTPERELLMHLERVFLAECAALGARFSDLRPR